MAMTVVLGNFGPLVRTRSNAARALPPLHLRRLWPLKANIRRRNSSWRLYLIISGLDVRKVFPIHRVRDTAGAARAAIVPGSRGASLRPAGSIERRRREGHSALPTGPRHGAGRS